MGEAEVMAALRDVAVVDQARTCLADTASRGSTAEEGEAADAWLIHARRDEQRVGQSHQRIVSRQQRTTVKARVALGAGERAKGLGENSALPERKDTRASWAIRRCSRAISSMP